MLLTIAHISESLGTLLNIKIPGMHNTLKKLKLPEEGGAGNLKIQCLPQ